MLPFCRLAWRLKRVSSSDSITANDIIRATTRKITIAGQGPKSQGVLERFLLGFPGQELSAELTGLLAGGLAGVAIYPRNFRDVAELRRLTHAIREAAGRPVLIGIDQEGGTKFSLGEPFTPWPSPAEFGRLGDISLIEQIARAMARELRAAGMNLNFAPMLDLATNPDSPVTLGRSFGSDPQHVAQMGCAFLRGLQAEGVLACAKHFPGHGDTAVDPHLDLPFFDGTRERLMAQELVPFAAAIKTGVPLIMTAHILAHRIDSAWPASLSRALLQSILREQLAFNGIILADDLGMGAIARRYENGESAVRTLEAGTDIAMLCHDWAAVAPALEAVAQAISDRRPGSGRDARMAAQLTAKSRSRIEQLRQQLRQIEKTDAPPVDTIGCPAHRTLAAKIRAKLNEPTS
ncbi:MAG: beta-N-acetylhexosaminidase [Acidobacteria bacterium]|nr:MAG: beta-N-acetylhexosaminidase [Acidobacteriota bacterium]